MFAKNAKRWTKEQIDQLKNCQEEGVPNIEGKSPNAVYRKMRSLGLHIQCKQPSWTKEELDIISSCDGKFVPEIKGRTAKAIRAKMNQMGIYDPLGKKLLSWTKQEVDILQRHIKDKKKGIPNIKGRSRDAIHKKMNSLGLKIIHSKNWTKEEIEHLKQLFHQGLELKLNNRSKRAVQAKVRELNLKKDRLYEQWTEEEINLLKNNKHVPGRSKRSINRKRIDLGLLKRKPRKSWTLKNEIILKKYVKEGYSASQILNIEVLPKKFSRTSIQKKICRMNLAKKMSSYKKFSEHNKMLFENFLKKNWQNKLPQELADQWNELYPKEKISYKRVIRYLSKLKIKVSSYEMGKIRRQKEKENNLSSVEFRSSKKFDEKIRSHRVELMRKRFEKSKNIWNGLEMKDYEIEAYGNWIK